MDLLDRLLHHDRWTTRRLLDLARGLSDEELDREFDLGPGTLRKTLAHIVDCVDAWISIMSGGTLPDRPAEDVSILALLELHEDSYDRFTAFARGIKARGAWDETWVYEKDDPFKQRTYGGTIAHVITHSMHHRSQALFMLRRLGIEEVPEGDALSAEKALGG